MSGTLYRDSETIAGNIVKLYKEGISFIKRQLYKKENDRDFNTEGVIEIPEIALQESYINALLHRNYFINSEIRLMVFDNRVEIASPGMLPNTLSVESIKSGIHIPRNPVLFSFAKDLLPYRGMGTGVKRIISSCEKAGIKVDFENMDNQFKVIFWRNQ